MTIFGQDQQKEHLMTKLDPLVKMIVDVTSNDYESYKDLLLEIAGWAKEENVAYSVTLVEEALLQAINMNYVESFSYSEKLQDFKFAKATTKELHNLFYIATVSGKQILS